MSKKKIINPIYNFTLRYKAIKSGSHVSMFRFSRSSINYGMGLSCKCKDISIRICFKRK